MILSKTSVTTFLLILFALSTYSQASQKAITAHQEKWETPAWAQALKNPFANNAAMTDSGRITYQKLCSVCHGSGGKGDGVAAAGLTVLPANHTSDIVQRQTDGALYYELTNGHSPMPSYKTVLTDNQRWQLVNFIRTLKPKPKK